MDLFVRLPDTTSCYMVSTLKRKRCHIAIHGRGHRTMVVHGAVARCSRIFHSSCYHLLVQLMYLESYGEYDATAGGCTNSEYQVLLYNFLLCRTRASISTQVQGFSG